MRKWEYGYISIENEGTFWTTFSTGNSSKDLITKERPNWPFKNEAYQKYVARLGEEGWEMFIIKNTAEVLFRRPKS